MSTRLMDRAIHLMRRYGALALPLRLAVGGFATLLAGTGLGFVAEYAAYSWAIYYGLRPPLEGIPYLKLAITALTVFILLGGAVVFLVVHVAASALLHYAEMVIGNINFYSRLVRKIAPTMDAETITGALITRYRQFSFRAALLTSLAVAIIAGAGTYAVHYMQRDSLPDPAPATYIAAAVFFGLLLLWDRNVRVWIALIAVIVVTVVVPSAFFHVGVYGKILRGLGYGGGLPVTVTVVEDPASGQQRTRHGGYLMLRTTSALLLFEPPTGMIREIPLQQVLFLEHTATPLSERPPKLPR